MYDLVHNRTELLDAAVTTSYTWDTNGNLSQKLTPTATTSYTHNIFNQLTEVTDTDTTTFEYDALGRRIEKTTGTTTYQYTWSGNQIIEVRDATGTVLWKHVYGVGLDEPIYLKIGTTRYYYTQDGLGSTSELTNSSGSKIEKYTYDIYGLPTIMSSTGTVRTVSSYNNTYMFTGQEYGTETGLYYYRARYYDVALGRFLETDPIGYAGGINLYGYVQNNPWNWTDPFGLAGLPIPEGGWGGGIPGLGTGTGIPPVNDIPAGGGPIGGDGPEGGNAGGIPGLGSGEGVPPEDDDPSPGDNFPTLPDSKTSGDGISACP